PAGGLPRTRPVRAPLARAHQRGVDDRDPPAHPPTLRNRPRPVPRPDPGQALGRVAHRGDGPQERGRPSRRIAHMLAVPPDPAGNAAEPGVLAARHERSAALLTDPLIRHWPMLRREYGGAERIGATGGPVSGGSIGRRWPWPGGRVRPEAASRAGWGTPRVGGGP